MGIQDRDYYRESTKGFGILGERMHTCVGLSLVFVLVFFVQVGTREDVGRHVVDSGAFTQTLEFDTSKIFAGEVWRVFTSPFLHRTDTIFPIAMTILFLLWIGRHVEDIYGWQEFLGYCLVTAFLGSLGLLIGAGLTQNPIHHVGPSGMITAVVLLYALHYPTRKINLFMLVPVPIWAFVAFYAVMDVIGFMGGGVHPAVIFSHFICAAFGLAYYQYSLRISNWIPSLPRTPAKRSANAPRPQLFTDTPAPDDVADGAVPVSRNIPVRPVTAAPEIADETAKEKLDEQLEAQMDAVLEKMNKFGRESLTEEEWAILRRASAACQKRRGQIG